MVLKYMLTLYLVKLLYTHEKKLCNCYCINMMIVNQSGRLSGHDACLQYAIKFKSYCCYLVVKKINILRRRERRKKINIFDQQIYVVGKAILNNSITAVCMVDLQVYTYLKRHTNNEEIYIE